MRRLLVAVCVLFLLPKGASAQLKVEIGAKAGLNLAGLGLSSDGKLSGVNYNGRTGFHLGAYGLIRKGKFGVQPEIVFSQQGQSYNTPNYSGLRSNLDYINVPIIFKYYPTGGISLQVGPQFGFLMSAKGDLVTITPSPNGPSLSVPNSNLNKDLKSYLNSTDFSIAFGAGLDLPLGLNLTFRYNYGVSNINKYPGTSGSGSFDSPLFSVAKTQNQVIQISISKKLLKIGK